MQHVVSFIENYAGQEGLSLPGRVPGYKTIHRVKLLPTATTKEELWRCYKHAVKIGGYTVVRYTKFVQTWNEFLPFIKIMQPSTDLCHTDQKNMEKISGHASASEEDKIEAVDASKHFLKDHPNITLLSPSHPYSLQGTVHYSYDPTSALS